MNKRQTMVAACLACVVSVAALFLLAGATLWLRVEPRSVSRTQFASIYEGMTAAELDRALGPPRNECRTSVMVWVPDGQGQLVSAKIMPGKPTIRFYPTSDHEQVWLTKTGLIAVSLDQAGRVQAKHFSTVHDIGGPANWLPAFVDKSAQPLP